jgi:FeS assembly protein IscX
MSKAKLKWTDTEEIAFRLIDRHPKIDPLSVRFTDLHRFVIELSDFGDSPKKSNEKILESIQMRWHEERQEMEDELGPVQGFGPESDELDEDDYRDDELDEPEVDFSSPDSDEDEEDEDDFGDGFQEEEVDDDR